MAKAKKSSAPAQAFRGDRLKERREARGWSQTELGWTAKVDVYAVSRYERGDQQPGSEAIKAICTALACSSDYLLGLKDSP